MYGKDKFYFLIEDIESSFSFYGNDTVWSGKVIDQNDRVVNDSFDITTLERGVDMYTSVRDLCYDDDDEQIQGIFDENDEIIDQQKYDELVEGIKDSYMEWYWEMDEDVSEYKEVNGHNCIKIAIEDFVQRHDIGHVGYRRELRKSYDFNSIQGLNALEEDCGSDLNFEAKWSAEFVYIDEFEWNCNYSDHIEGWLHLFFNDYCYIAYRGLKDAESQKMLSEIESSEELYNALKNMLYDAAENHASLAELKSKHDVCIIEWI